MKKQITSIDLEKLTAEGERRLYRWCLHNNVALLMNIGDLMEYLFAHGIQDTVNAKEVEDVSSENMCNVLWAAVKVHLNAK